MTSTIRMAVVSLVLVIAAACSTKPALAPVQPRAPWPMPVSVEGAGPPLVMLGGGVQGAAAFAPHAQQLATARQVIRLESLNIDSAEKGRTLPDDYSVAMEQAAMRQALDGLGLHGPVDVLGWSYGALIALDFALAYPDRVRSLTLVEPPAFWIVENDAAMDEDMRRMVQLLRGFGPRTDITEDQLEAFRCALGGCPPPGQSIRDDPRWPGMVQERGRLRGLSAVAEQRGDVRCLEQFRRPVLIVTGTSTVSFHRRLNELLMQRFPNVHRQELPGGHASPITAREQFVSAVSAFLAARP